LKVKSESYREESLLLTKRAFLTHFVFFTSSLAIGDKEKTLTWERKICPLSSSLLIRKENGMQTKTNKGREILKEERGAESSTGSAESSSCAMNGEEYMREIT
jgi:hypothetical protein